MQIRSLALFVLAVTVVACSAPPPPPPPKPVATAEDPTACLVSDRGAATVTLPWGDAAKMKALEGVEPRGTAKVSISWPKEDEVLPEGKGTVLYAVAPSDKSPPCRLVLDNVGLATDVGGATTLEALNGGKPLAEGSHLLSVFLVGTAGLAQKFDGALAQVRFHVKSKKGKLPANDTEQVIWNLPDGFYDSAKGQAHNVLCDFCVKNVLMADARLMKLDNVVVLVVDPAGKRETIKGTDWAPLVILKDPRPGTYKVTLSIEERDDGDPIDVPFGETTREITIQ